MRARAGNIHTRKSPSWFSSPGAFMAGTTTTTKKQAWDVNCDCGFMVRDYNQKELVQLVQTHVNTTHNKTVSEKDVLGMAKPAKV